MADATAEDLYRQDVRIDAAPDVVFEFFVESTCSEHRLAPADRLAQHAEGWDHFLPRLAVAAAGGDPGPDPWLDESPH